MGQPTDCRRYVQRLYTTFVVQTYPMHDSDIKRLQELAIEQLKKVFTKEQALEALVRAGILDKDGNHTEPYKNLGKASAKAKLQHRKSQKNKNQDACKAAANRE